MLRRVALLILAAGLLFGQTGNSVRPVTLPDFAGTSTTVQVAASGQARWIQFIAASGNTGVSRWGDVNTSASRGGRLPAGSGQYVNAGGDANTMPLSLMYLYVASGDTVTVIYGQ